MGGQHSRNFIKFLAKIIRRDAYLPSPHLYSGAGYAINKPARDRAKIKAARKQNRQRKGGAK